MSWSGEELPAMAGKFMWKFTDISRLWLGAQIKSDLRKPWTSLGDLWKANATTSSSTQVAQGRGRGWSQSLLWSAPARACPGAVRGQLFPSSQRNQN